MTCEKHTTRNIHPSKLLTFTPTMRSMYKMKVPSGGGKRAGRWGGGRNGSSKSGGGWKWLLRGSLWELVIVIDAQPWSPPPFNRDPPAPSSLYHCYSWGRPICMDINWGSTRFSRVPWLCVSVSLSTCATQRDCWTFFRAEKERAWKKGAVVLTPFCQFPGESGRQVLTTSTRFHGTAQSLLTGIFLTEYTTVHKYRITF